MITVEGGGFVLLRIALKCI